MDEPAVVGSTTPKVEPKPVKMWKSTKAICTAIGGVILFIITVLGFVGKLEDRYADHLAAFRAQKFVKENTTEYNEYRFKRKNGTKAKDELARFAELQQLAEQLYRARFFGKICEFEDASAPHAIRSRADAATDDVYGSVGAGTDMVWIMDDLARGHTYVVTRLRLGKRKQKHVIAGWVVGREGEDLTCSGI